MRTMKDSGIEWIGEIPASWGVTKLKNLLLSNDGGVWGNEPQDNAADKVVLRSTEQTIDGEWSIINPAKRNLSGINYSKYRILPNDLLMTKSSGSSLHIGKTTLAGDYFNNNECYYSNFMQRLRVRDERCVPKYLWYILNSPFVREQFVFMQNSTSGLSNINAENISNIQLPKAPLDEQKKIADFLDGKCAEIDELVQTEEKMIEELKAYKQSVITEAVTKGLDPAAPMKDSGIEWTGKIPASWEVGRMKYVADINAPCKDVKQYERISYAPMECIKRGWMECQEISPLESSSGLTTFEENDIVMAKVTPCFENGNIAVAKDLINGVALGSSELFVFRARTVLTEWLFYFLQNSKFTDLAKSTMVGTGGLKRVSPKFVSNYQMGVPPLCEQKQIADYLDEKCAKIDEIIALRTEQINQLKEYKKSLIYEYVTGKKEVV